MRVLFDQATPVPIRPYFERHSVRTAAQQGWDKLRNGDLLDAAEEAGFDLLLTTDKNICYQQNLEGRKIAIVVLGQQQWPRLRPYVQRVVEAVNASIPAATQRWISHSRKVLFRSKIDQSMRGMASGRLREYLHDMTNGLSTDRVQIGRRT
jgi:hypothetical protein